MPRIEQAPTSVVTFTFDGQTIEAHEGESIAAALLAAGHRVFRSTPLSGAPRGPLCMMGVCFDCLVQIDGQGNQQACMHEVRAGLVVARQDGAFDALAAKDTP